MARIFVYTALVLSLFTVVQGKNTLQRKLRQQEIRYLVNCLEAKIRINNTNARILEKDIVRLRKALGKYNEELNPFE